MKLKLTFIIKPQETLIPAVHKHKAILVRKQKMPAKAVALAVL